MIFRTYDSLTEWQFHMTTPTPSTGFSLAYWLMTYNIDDDCSTLSALSCHPLIYILNASTKIVSFISPNQCRKRHETSVLCARYACNDRHIMHITSLLASKRKKKKWQRLNESSQNKQGKLHTRTNITKFGDSSHVIDLLFHHFLVIFFLFPWSICLLCHLPCVMLLLFCSGYKGNIWLAVCRAPSAFASSIHIYFSLFFSCLNHVAHIYMFLFMCTTNICAAHIPGWSILPNRNTVVGSWGRAMFSRACLPPPPPLHIYPIYTCCQHPFSYPHNRIRYRTEFSYIFMNMFMFEFIVIIIRYSVAANRCRGA